jgi:hypothetical protein
MAQNNMLSCHQRALFCSPVAAGFSLLLPTPPACATIGLQLALLLKAPARPQQVAHQGQEGQETAGNYPGLDLMQGQVQGNDFLI